MSIVTYQQSGPPSSAEFRVIDVERAADVADRQAVVGEFLERQGYDALLLELRDNFAWFTAGGDGVLSGSAEPAACLFITPEARVIVTNNIDSGLLFDRELNGLGFQLKERPWHEPPSLLIDDLCRGRKVASDSGRRGTTEVSVHLAGMRIPLSENEGRKLRELGRLVAHAVEATARQLSPGRIESEIAGELAHRLFKHSIVPERMQVCGDGRGRRYRHWRHSDQPVERYCVISAVGRRDGLHAGVSRTVSFGPAPREIRDAHHRALLMQATGMYFSQRDWELFEVWNRVERIYEKFNYPNEWRLAQQAEVVGYNLCEAPLVPKSEFRLAVGMPVFWHPSVGPAVIADTILVGERGFELLTPMEQWPRVTVKVKGISIVRPGILERDVSDHNVNGNGNDSVLSFDGLD